MPTKDIYFGGAGAAGAVPPVSPGAVGMVTLFASASYSGVSWPPTTEFSSLPPHPLVRKAAETKLRDKTRRRTNLESSIKKNPSGVVGVVHVARLGRGPCGPEKGVKIIN